MTTEALKSTAITNMDALPPVRPTTGEGGAGILRHVDGVITTTTGKTSGSTYMVVRVPTNAKVKHVIAYLDAAVTTFTADIGVYYSSSSYDGTPSAIAGTAVDADRFGSAIDLKSVITPTDYTNESTGYTGAKRLQPLWQACGLSADPGGYFDIGFTNTATNSDAATAYLEVEYVV